MSILEPTIFLWIRKKVKRMKKKLSEKRKKGNGYIKISKED